jgi:hypothetical protein
MSLSLLFFTRLCAGLAWASIALCFFDIGTIIFFSRAIPNVSHNVEWEDHGSARYMTNAQFRTLYIVPPIGICATFLAAKLKGKAYSV